MGDIIHIPPIVQAELMMAENKALQAELTRLRGLEKVQEFLLILHNQDPTHDTCMLLDAVQHALAQRKEGRDA